VKWYEYDHPQLGLIELGGWDNMFTWRNPPHKFMGEESERNVPFALSLGRMLPLLEIKTIEIYKISNDVYTINLVIDNSGFLPTFTSEQGKNRAVIRPVRVELEIPDSVEVLNGRLKTELGHLEGRSNKIGAIFIIASPTDNRRRIEWTLKGKIGNMVTLHIRSERAGTIHKQLVLE